MLFSPERSPPVNPIRDGSFERLIEHANACINLQARKRNKRAQNQVIVCKKCNRMFPGDIEQYKNHLQNDHNMHASSSNVKSASSRSLSVTNHSSSSSSSTSSSSPLTTCTVPSKKETRASAVMNIISTRQRKVIVKNNNKRRTNECNEDKNTKPRRKTKSKSNFQTEKDGKDEIKEGDGIDGNNENDNEEENFECSQNSNEGDEQLNNLKHYDENTMKESKTDDLIDDDDNDDDADDKVNGNNEEDNDEEDVPDIVNIFDASWACLELTIRNNKLSDVEREKQVKTFIEQSIGLLGPYQSYISVKFKEEMKQLLGHRKSNLYARWASAMKIYGELAPPPRSAPSDTIVIDE